MLTTANRKWREARMVVKGLQSPRHPVLAQIVPIRRCNLACAYCNEFDNHSSPVPLDTMLERIDHLARLGTTTIELSGGEPLLHPELDTIIRRIRWHGVLAGLITNGYLLSQRRIERLNDAGLDHLQISIDNILPDEISKKSLKVLDQKLTMLARHATFSVNVNSVLGGTLRDPEDALTVARRAIELGLTATVGLIHNGHGELVPLSPDQLRAYRGDRAHDRAFLLGAEPERLPAQPGTRPPERLALWSGWTVSIHLRRWARALVLATARPPGDSTG